MHSLGIYRAKVTRNQKRNYLGTKMKKIILIAAISMHVSIAHAESCVFIEPIIAECDSQSCFDGFRVTIENGNNLIKCDGVIEKYTEQVTPEDLNKVFVTKTAESGIFEYKDFGTNQENLKTEFNTLEEAKTYWLSNKNDFVRNDSMIIFYTIIALTGIFFILSKKMKKGAKKK